MLNYYSLRECSEKLIKTDRITILQLINMGKNDGIFLLSLIPYFALYCRSVQEFTGNTIIEDEIDRQIYDLRNGLKLNSEKYNKVRKIALDIDNQQDKYFRSKLRFKITQKLNIHYNLGIYVNSGGQIIGNTQMLNYYLMLPALNNKDPRKRAYKIGKILGQKIFELNTGFNNPKDFSLYFPQKSIPPYGYIDINTNTRNSFFAHPENKDINLIILHMLSAVGFSEHVLFNVLPFDNPWLCRTRYIVAHYVWTGLKKLIRHYQNNDSNIFPLEKATYLFDKGQYYFPSDFRNCMMHYDFINNNVSAIKESCFRKDILFFGLTESCFNGLSTVEFYSQLKDYLHELEEYLSSWFIVDLNKIK